MARSIGRIGPGLCVLVGVTLSDDTQAARRLAAKLWQLRILDDDQGRMNRSLADLANLAGRAAAAAEAEGHRDGIDPAAQVLVVSQFTLYGDTSRGRRPSWAAAAPPAQAEPLVEELVSALVAEGAAVATGRFGADMAVELVNDGPVTLLVEV